LAVAVQLAVAPAATVPYEAAESEIV